MRLFRSLIVVAIVATPALAVAQNVTPSFGATVPAGWSTDRYDPTTFALTNATHGRNDVLNIGITSAGDLANRPAAYQSTFYNTQGKGMALGAAAGSWSLTADLWVNGSWATNIAGSNNSRRTDMWGVAVNNANSAWDYPIIGFTNGSGLGLFRGYDVNSGAWMNFASPVNYGAWNTLEMSWNSVSAMYSYYVNGTLAGTVQGDGGAVGIGSMIMQAYNFNDPSLDPLYGSTNYTAQWSNTPSATVPEPATIALLATGLLGVFAVVRRRRAAAVVA